MNYNFNFIEKAIRDFKNAGIDPREETIVIYDLTMKEMKEIETFTKGRIKLNLKSIYI